MPAMYEEGGLAATGMGVMTIGGIGFGLNWIVGAGIAAVLVGAAAVRLATRKRRFAGGRA